MRAAKQRISFQNVVFSLLTPNRCGWSRSHRLELETAGFQSRPRICYEDSGQRYREPFTLPRPLRMLECEQLASHVPHSRQARTVDAHVHDAGMDSVWTVYAVGATA
eukprot:795316-Rhodomonas_salina.1